nr:MAG TPA: hypothetical protein [Caudoviricetes sp.]
MWWSNVHSPIIDSLAFANQLTPLCLRRITPLKFKVYSEKIPCNFAASLDFLQPERRTGISLNGVGIDLVHNEPFPFVRVGIRYTNLCMEVRPERPHLFGQLHADKVAFKVIVKLGPSWVPSGLVKEIGVNGNRNISTHDPVHHGLKGLSASLVTGKVYPCDFSSLQIHHQCLIYQCHQSGVVVEDVRDITIVGLEFNQRALGADFRSEYTAKQRVCNRDMAWLIENIASGKSALLRNNAETVSLYYRKIAFTEQCIQDIVYIPCLGHSDLVYTEYILYQIPHIILHYFSVICVQRIW